MALEKYQKRLVEIVGLAAIVGLFAFHVAYRESHRGGFPIFSHQTWEAIWPWVLLLVVLLVIRLGPLVIEDLRSRRHH